MNLDWIQVNQSNLLASANDDAQCQCIYMFINILTRFYPESIRAAGAPIQGIRSRKQYYSFRKMDENNSTNFSITYEGRESVIRS